ncbi:hypothetical protein PanWU01x14_091090 [Parasponia andersonii]|uniref:Uncharacterized protein n=1 Tax=Parasponia andersonii TaxID=3476 RepID=A0A2P5D733_PARAD|nr:hypothetical protein PanWU01x14_091090 [Parasponia andersonii]
MGASCREERPINNGHKPVFELTQKSKPRISYLRGHVHWWNSEYVYDIGIVNRRITLIEEEARRIVGKKIELGARLKFLRKNASFSSVLGPWAIKMDPKPWDKVRGVPSGEI